MEEDTAGGVPTTFEEMKEIVPTLVVGDAKELLINRNIFQQVMDFYLDKTRSEMEFTDTDGNSTLTTSKRKLVHEIVGPLGLGHYSAGRGNKRILRLLKNPRTLCQGRFNRETNAWEAVPEGPTGQHWNTDEGRLTLVSFNVLMDVPESQKERYNVHDVIYTAHRWPAIYNILGESKAHFIALQEVTAEFQKGLMEQEWVRQRYYVSDILPDNFSFMGNLFLSVFPFDKILVRNYSHEFGEPKVTVEGYIDSLNGRKLSIYNLHLKAGTACAVDREREIHENITVQLGTPGIQDAILLGDFNMRDIAQERNARLEEHYVDLWKEFKGIRTDQPLSEEDVGYTYDLDKNPTAKAVSDVVSAIKKTQGYSSRFDRIQFHSKSTTKDEGEKEKDTRRRVNEHMGDWAVEDMKMIGTEPIYESPFGQAVLPSDHYGLLVHLRYCP